ncbi:MAG TPA: S1 family peptidase [Pilimelia sp.]|nr:S1 family peptidase [Pilimelia sp.]
MDTSTTALFEAMQRDLGLTREQAVRRFDDEAAATRLATELQPKLGAEFAGAWFDEATGRLAVAATSTAAADQARAAGAIAKVVRYSLSDLQSAKTELDDAQRAEPTRMADAISWGADPQRNAMVVTVRTGRTVPAVTELVNRRGDMVRIEESDDVPRTMDYLDGGDPMGKSSLHDNCSVGFNVYSGATVYLLTAGHCGKTNNNAYSKGVPIGPYVQSWFPVYDDALVRNDRLDKWTVGPWVATYSADDTAYIVRGQIINILNGSTCKSGKTTKITCGVLKQFGQTVQYDSGNVVYNLTRHTACTKSGDSGGANFTWPSSDGKVSALGMTSGSILYTVNGVERCGSEIGKTNQSWFYPVGDSLAWYKVKLYTG